VLTGDTVTGGDNVFHKLFITRARVTKLYETAVTSCHPARKPLILRPAGDIAMDSSLAPFLTRLGGGDHGGH
jgi:hypothetical protein